MTGVSTFWGLTRFNLRHLLLSPVFLVLMPLTLLGLAYSAHQPAMPTWSDLIDQTKLQIVVVAAVMFAITTFPAIREVRHSEGFALPLSSRARLLALILASVIVTSGGVGALIAFHVLSASAPIAGTASPFALLSLFVLSWCGPLSAVASAAWTRSYAPLVMLLLLVPAYLLYTLTSMGTRADEVLRRLGGVANWVLDPLPIVQQPAVTELAFLTLLHTLFLAAFLLAFALAGRAEARTFRPVSLCAAGVLLAGLFSVTVHVENTYTYDSPFTDDQLYGAEADPCRVREGVTYCPLPGYESWVDYWHAALGPAMAQVPERAQNRVPTLWQGNQNLRRDVQAFRPADLSFPRDDHSFPPEGTVIVYDHWDPEVPYFREELVIEVTTAVLGLPRYHEGLCEGTGQARIVVGAWLVSVDETLSEAESLNTAENFLAAFNPSPLDLRVAHTVIALPPESVAPVVEKHWERLLSPDTTTEELAKLLELPLSGDDVIPEPNWGRSLWAEYPAPIAPDWYGPTCR